MGYTRTQPLPTIVITLRVNRPIKDALQKIANKGPRTSRSKRFIQGSVSDYIRSMILDKCEQSAVLTREEKQTLRSNPLHGRGRSM